MSGLQFTDELIGHLAWPVFATVIVVIIGWRFHGPVGARIAKMRSLDLPGGVKATFDPDELASAGSELVSFDAERLEWAMSDLISAAARAETHRDTRHITVEDESASQDDSTVSKSDDAIDWGPILDRYNAELARRAEVEKIIGQAARWGYEKAVTDYPENAENSSPIIEWSDDNEPRIIGAESWNETARRDLARRRAAANDERDRRRILDWYREAGKAFSAGDVLVDPKTNRSVTVVPSDIKP